MSDIEKAYQYYRDLGPGRSLAKVAKEFRVTQRTCHSWASLGQWQARLAKDLRGANSTEKVSKRND